MKIPKTLIPQTSPVSQTPSTSSTSSCHSTISSSSSAVIAATASSSLSPSPSPSSSPSRRCEGLDLLVKAIYQVDEGSVIGVPYIQRRIIRRRKPAIRFANPFLVDHDELDLKRRSGAGVNFKCLKPKRRRSCKG